MGRHWGDWRSEATWLWRLSEAHGSRGVLGDVGIHILDMTTFAIGMMPVSLIHWQLTGDASRVPAPPATD